MPKKTIKVKAAHVNHKLRAEMFERANISMAEKLHIANDALKTAADQNKDARDAWTLEHNLRTQANEALAKLEENKTSIKDKVIIVFNNTQFTQKLDLGDTFTFTHDEDANRTGAYTINYAPVNS